MDKKEGGDEWGSKIKSELERIEVQVAVLRERKKGMKSAMSAPCFFLFLLSSVPFRSSFLMSASIARVGVGGYSLFFPLLFLSFSWCW